MNKIINEPINLNKEDVHEVYLKYIKKATSNKNAIVKLFEFVPKFLIDLISIYEEYSTNILPLPFLVKQLDINTQYLKDTIQSGYYRGHSLLSTKILKIEETEQCEFVRLNYTPIIKELYTKYKNSIL